MGSAASPAASTISHVSALGVAPPRVPDPAAWNRFFEAVYRAAGDDPQQVPWGDDRPNPYLVEWLNDQAPGVVRPGARVIVPGCGLGREVRVLADRGYEVSGFDVSPQAVEWARRLYPDLSDRFLVANLFDLPPTLRRRADLVAEVYTIQSVHPELREGVVEGIASLARPHGVIVAICRARRPGEGLDVEGGPPFPLAPGELMDLFGKRGFVPLREPEVFPDWESPETLRLRCAFRRA